MTREITRHQARLLRMQGQSLARDAAAPSVVDAVRSSGGLQAQSWPAAVLSARPRVRDATASDVERARFEERSLVRTWLMRGTLHLVAADDIAWLTGLLGPPMAAKQRTRLGQLGLDDRTLESGVRAIVEALAARGPLTRAEIAAELERRDTGIDTRSQALIHTLQEAATGGLIAYGAGSGRAETFVLLDDWLPAATRRAHPRLRGDAALDELALRHLRAFGPARPADFAAWSGLPMAAARDAFGRLAPKLAEVRVDGAAVWLPRAQMARLDDAAPDPEHAEPSEVRLLAAWDTYLLGYRDRAELLPEGAKLNVLTTGGVLPQTVVRDGVIVGTWRLDCRRRTASAAVELFDDGRDPSVRSAVDAELADVGRFLSRPVTTADAAR